MKERLEPYRAILFVAVVALVLAGVVALRSLKPAPDPLQAWTLRQKSP